MKKGMKRNFIPPKSIYNLLKHNNRQGNEYKGGNMHLTVAIKVLQQAIHSQQEEDGQEKMVSNEDDYEEDDMGNNEDREINKGNEDCNSQDNMVNNGKDMLLEKEGESNITGKRKLKKSYKTKTPRGPTRNLQIAKMRPGEKIKVDFNVSGQPIGANRAKLSSYCGCLVRDPLNAPPHGVEEFFQVPEQNKEKMWKLVLDKFDIGLDDDQEEEKREKRRRERRKYIITSLNKKYRNYHARLKSEYYDVEENDEDRLKEENRPHVLTKKIGNGL